MDIFGNFSKLKGDREKRQVRAKNELDFSYGDVALEPVGQVEEKAKTQSTFLFRAGVILVFSLLLFRVFSLQVVKGSENSSLALGNKIRPRVIEAPRGLITDSNGVWLARNQPSYALAVHPSDLPKKKADREDKYAKIAQLSGLSADEIRADIQGNGTLEDQNSRLLSLDEILLKENIPHDAALVLEEKISGLSGFYVAQKAIREYQILPGIAHLLGYTGKVSSQDLSLHPDYLSVDNIGKSGLESQYEADLRGSDGVEQIEVDSKQNVIRVLLDNANTTPVPGDSLVTNIDSGLQQTTGDALAAGIATGKTLTGQDVNGATAIVMDVNTGGILSMVSLPDYNDNLFSPSISNADYQQLINDKNLPLFDRAVQGVYPPGSVSKIILASAGLMEGNITPSTSIVSPAAIKIGDYTFPDWKDHGYESTNVERAIAESNNIFFYSVGGGYGSIKGLGIDTIKKWWELFGLGEKTGIDLPTEAAGLLPDPAWLKKTRGSNWYIGDTYHVSIGQGDLLVTPLQMLRATAAIANGGKLLIPQLAKEIVDPNGKVVEQFGPKIERQNFLNPSVVKTVQEGMRLTVTGGSARNLNDLPFPVAGKTGTAQFMDNTKTHAWFECYAPYDNPQIAVLVMVEGGGEGYDVAAPVAKQILSYYFANKH